MTEPRLSFDQVRKILGFLLAVRWPEHRSTFVKQGFDDAAERRGWRQLCELVPTLTSFERVQLAHDVSSAIAGESGATCSSDELVEQFLDRIEELEGSNSKSAAGPAPSSDVVICRSLELLLGLRHVKAAAALRKAGFEESEEVKGWDLVLTAATSLTHDETAKVLTSLTTLLKSDRLSLSGLQREHTARLVERLKSAHPALAADAQRALRLHAD
jgi:hypothetical protein